MNTRKIRILGKSIPLLPLIAVALMTSTVFGAFIFLYPKPATVSITKNVVAFELYENEACTIVITTIDFGSLKEKSYSDGTTVTTSSMWIKLDETAAWVEAGWECNDLPLGMTLTGKCMTEGKWCDWSATELREMGASMPTAEVHWTLDIGNADHGDYDFTINLVSESHPT